MTDELPLFVCRRCFYFLNISYKLIVDSVKADAILRSKLETETIELDSPSSESNLTMKEEFIVKIDSSQLSKKYIEDFDESLKIPIKCDLCDKIFQDMNIFDTHIEEEHLLEWPCNFCDNSYKESKDLLMHKSFSHSGEITTCRDCSSPKLTMDASLKEHDKEEADLSTFKEESSADRRETNTVTVERENNVSEISCNVCKTTVENIKLLVMHNKIHESKVARCRTCQLRCYSIYELFLHKKAAHNMYRKVNLKYVCDMCDKFFSNSSQWEHHIDKTCPRKFSIYSCKYCKSTFSTNHKLTFHLRVSNYLKVFYLRLSAFSITQYREFLCTKLDQQMLIEFK